MMDRRSILAGVVILCVLAGSYIVISRPDLRNEASDKSAEAELAVDEFESEDSSSDEATVPASDVDGSSPSATATSTNSATSSATHAGRGGNGNVETIEDDSGEVLEPTITIEDDEERGTVVNSQSTSGQNSN